MIAPACCCGGGFHAQVPRQYQVPACIHLTAPPHIHTNRRSTTRQNKERVWQQHRIANLIEQIRRRAEDLEAIYEDKDGCVLRLVVMLLIGVGWIMGAI